MANGVEFTRWFLAGFFVFVTVFYVFRISPWKSRSGTSPVFPGRPGTRTDDDAPLITTGPFSHTRNPMMMGVQTAQLGLFLALPSVFTLACLVIGAVAVQLQVRVEEGVLRTRHGEAYEAYMSSTPRWLL